MSGTVEGSDGGNLQPESAFDNTVKQAADSFSAELGKNTTQGINTSDQGLAYPKAQVVEGQLIVTPLQLSEAAKPITQATDAQSNVAAGDTLQKYADSMAKNPDPNIAGFGKLMEERMKQGAPVDDRTAGFATMVGKRIEQGLPVALPQIDKMAGYFTKQLDQHDNAAKPTTQATDAQSNVAAGGELQKYATSLATNPDQHVAKFGKLMEERMKQGAQIDDRTAGFATMVGKRIEQGLPVAVPQIDAMAAYFTKQLEQ